MPRGWLPCSNKPVLPSSTASYQLGMNSRSLTSPSRGHGWKRKQSRRIRRGQRSHGLAWQVTEVTSGGMPESGACGEQCASLGRKRGLVAACTSANGSISVGGSGVAKIVRHPASVALAAVAKLGSFLSRRGNGRGYSYRPCTCQQTLPLHAIAAETLAVDSANAPAPTTAAESDLRQTPELSGHEKVPSRISGNG